MQQHLRDEDLSEVVLPACPINKALKGQKALVTGANSGIGKAVALALAHAGADVVVNYVSRLDAAETVVKEAMRCGANVYAHKANVADEAEVQMMFKKMIQEFGTIDILVNNAGLQKDAKIEDMTLEDWQFVLSNLGSRPVTNLSLRIRPDTFAGLCTLVETADLAATPVNLFALGGGAFDFPDTFQLLPGSVVQVIGRPDVTSTTCIGLNIEVLDISLATIPARSDGDADGNLLIDSWEKMLLGMLGSDPFGDGDGDGYSNPQEMFEGTDPNDGFGVPIVPRSGLNLPALSIETSTEGGVRIAWFWPEAYLGKVQFQILSTSDLNLVPTPQLIVPLHQGGGNLRATIPNPGTETQFFRVAIQLRP